MGRHYCFAHLMGHIALIHVVGKCSWFIVIACLFACGQETQNSISKESPAKPPQKIVSLAPHLTELIYSLGAEEKLIASVEYSDYPEAAKTIPRIGDAFRIDWEKLAQLQPDLILAWEGGNPQSLLDELVRRNYRVEKYRNASLFDLPKQIEQLAELLEVTELEISDDYSHGLQELVAEYADKKSINVFYQISAQPIYSIGSTHVISEMLTVCGARNVFSEHAELSSPLSPEAILGASPDVVLTTAYAYEEVSKTWEQLESISHENILKVPGDEVSRASLRMLQGVKNICEELDIWRQKNKSLK